MMHVIVAIILHIKVWNQSGDIYCKYVIYNKYVLCELHEELSWVYKY